MIIIVIIIVIILSYYIALFYEYYITLNIITLNHNTLYHVQVSTNSGLLQRCTREGAYVNAIINNVFLMRQHLQRAINAASTSTVYVHLCSAPETTRKT